MEQATLTEQVNAVISTLTADIHNNKLEIPSPPDLLIKLRQLTNDENSTATDIAKLIKHDPNISARLIKVANSVLLAGRNPATSTQSAVARLGQKRVQSLIVGLLIGQRLLEFRIKGLTEYCQQAWQDSISVAAISSALAKEHGIDSEQALLAGIVHNIGTLPIILKLNKIEVLKSRPDVLKLVADKVIPKLYPLAGKLILKNWNFTDDIIEIAISHRANNKTPSDNISLSDIVFIAYHLNQLNLNDTDIKLPDSLTQSPAYQKIWTNQEDASNELHKLVENIEQIKTELS